MKRSPLNKIGKIGRINLDANKKLKDIYFALGINRCEVGLENCMPTFGLSWHHRHKRVWYRSCAEKLSEFNQTLLVCPSCHSALENDPILTSELFTNLRGLVNN